MRLPPPLLRCFFAYPLFRTAAAEGTHMHHLKPFVRIRNNRSLATTTSNSNRRQFQRRTLSAFLSVPSSTRRNPRPQASVFFNKCRNNPRHHPLFPLQRTTCPVVLFSSSTNNNQNQGGDLLTSTSSNTVKRFVGLQQKAKKRREAGETVVEGPRMVLDLLRNPNTRHLIQQILVSQDLDVSIERELQSLLQDGSSNIPIDIQRAMPHVVAACSDTVTPQGIVARVRIPTWTTQDIMMVPSSQSAAAPLYLILDGVSDPGNVGTLLRSSVAVGVAAVLLLPGSCDVWNPKAVRSAMGSSFVVPTLACQNWDEAWHILQKEWNCQPQHIWAATMLQDEETGRVVSSAHYDVDWTRQPQALIIGNEGTGLSPTVRATLKMDDAKGDDASDSPRIQAVHVPMEGPIESLNAAVCGSVIMFEYMRQQQQT